LCDRQNAQEFTKRTKTKKLVAQKMKNDLEGYSYKGKKIINHSMKRDKKARLTWVTLYFEDKTEVSFVLNEDGPDIYAYLDLNK